MEQKRFEEKIKPILNYVGTIGAILMAIAYMAATSAKESYQAGIEGGLGDRQAGLLLLANTAAMWKLMDISQLMLTK